MNDLTLRRYAHHVAQGKYTNEWVADFKPFAATQDVLFVVVHIDEAADAADEDEPKELYSVFPKAANQTFFASVPLWVFCGSQRHVAHAKIPDIYPYFQLGYEAGDDWANRVFVVMAPTVEAAKSKLMAATSQH